MENQHTKITGYRDLTQGEIDLMNEVKKASIKVHVLVSALEQLDLADQRWVEIGKTDLQTGFMALTRSIAQPTTF